MPERTEHARQRHAQEDRPTREAAQDREKPLEIYYDLETGNRIYVGPSGRTHIFTPDGKHHTSFRTTHRARQRRVEIGRWVRVRSAWQEAN